MMIALLRIDRAFDRIWGSWIVAVSFGIGLRFLSSRYPDFASIPFSQQAPAFGIVFVTMMLLFSFILISTNINNRCSRICLAIPVRAKDLWVARIISIAVSVSIPIVLIALILSFKSGAEGTYIDNAVLRLGFKCLTAMIFAAMVFQSWKTELYRIPLTKGYLAFLILGSLVISGATFIGMSWPFTGYLYLAAALLLGTRIFRSLPGSFRVCSFRPVDAPAYGPVVAVNNSPVSGSPVRANGSPAGSNGYKNGATRLERPVHAGKPTLKTFITLARGLLNNWKVWVYSILMAFYTFMIMVTYTDGASRDNPYGIFLYTWIWMVLIEVLMRMYKLEYLPISRKTIFAYAWGAILVSLTVGITAGSILTSTRSRNFRQIRFYKQELHVPHEFFEISTDGPPPPVSAPWGETYTPVSHPLYSGSDIYIYNPYSWNQESSTRFIALQLDRAKEAVHGLPYDRDSNYEEIDEDLEKMFESCCFSLSGIDNRSVPRARAFTVAASIAAALYCIIFFLSFRAYGALRFKTLLAWVFPGSLILIVLTVVVVIIAGMMGYTTANVVQAVPAILMRKTAEAIPLNLAGLWAIFTAVVVLGTLLVYSGFRRSESIASLGKSILKDY
ncbi:MAG TPA: hypothetical protein VLA34_15505 [Candidatus Krumholzibacterium sp.]|nr:hypothetical protein [Candidatus Krumholzibacterium sp.]